MIFEQLNPGNCRTYLIGSERTRDVVLIDPILDKAKDYLDFIRKEKLKLKWVMDTHTHADHVSGCALIQQLTGVDYLMHRKSSVSCVSHHLEDGESIGIGDVTLRFAHAPGHTVDSLAVMLPDRFLSGDFIFIGTGGAGRLDLPGGNIEAHYKSLRILDALPDETLVFPAHDYQGAKSSTLKSERASNPVLQPRSRDEYLHYWNSLKMGPAEWMKDVLRANAKCVVDTKNIKIPKDISACQACAPAGVNVPQYSPKQVQKKMKEATTFILDVRGQDEYISELHHIHGSHLIPLAQLPDRLSELPKDKPIITICRSGKRSADAADMLLKAGLHDVHSMTGGMLAWNKLDLPVE